MSEVETQPQSEQVKCSRCRHVMEVEMKNGRPLKTCTKCRSKRKVTNNLPYDTADTNTNVETNNLPDNLDQPELKRNSNNFNENYTNAEPEYESDDDCHIDEQALSNFIVLVQCFNDEKPADELFTNQEQLEERFNAWIEARFNPELLQM